MKTEGTPRRYISGPHSPDYYLLLDEQADHLFATRLATRLREARASLLEIWSDDAEKQLWYVFETSSQPRVGE